MVYKFFPGSAGFWGLDSANNLPHVLEHQTGAVGEVPDGLAAGNAGEHQGGIQARFDTGYNIGIHTVADNGGFLGVDAQELEARAHHEGVGLADKVGVFPGDQLNGGHQCPAGRRDAVALGAGEVKIGADELGALVHKMHGLDNAVIIIVIGFPDDDIVGVDLVDGDAGVIQGVEKAMLPHGVGRGFRVLGSNKAGGCLGAGVKMAFVHIQAHPAQFLLQFHGGAPAGVGEEQKLLVLPVEPFHKLLGAGEQPVAVVDDAVHINDKSLFLSQLFHAETILSAAWGKAARSRRIGKTIQTNHIPPGEKLQEEPKKKPKKPLPAGPCRGFAPHRIRGPIHRLSAFASEAVASH